MKNHLLWRWDFRALLCSVFGVGFGWILMFPVANSWQVKLNQALEDQSFPMILPGMELGSVEEWHLVFDRFDSIFHFSVVVVLLSFLGSIVFGVLFCRRYFSAEARCQRRLDFEDRLEEERRRRRKGGGR